MTIVGGKMAPPPGDDPMLQTCLCFVKDIHAVLKITSYRLPAYQLHVGSESVNLACEQFCMVLSKIGC